MMLPNTIRPARIRLDVSSVCQLRCPLCPVHGENKPTSVGHGFLEFSRFRDLVEANPWVKDIELANYGEFLLNPELLRILEFAHSRGVAVRAEDGANLNKASDELLEGLVKYQLRSINCSIDGASNETYSLYRVNGDFDTVMENVKKLNSFKTAYRSQIPELRWQFIVFGHNEHEIPRARAMAAELGMKFRLKLSWDSGFSPARNEELLRSEFGAASREEFRERFGVDYVREICYQLWNHPQINWDGKVLGCSRNFWGDFGGNAFTDGLLASINSPGLRYARKMLLGKEPAKDDIPCTNCGLYQVILAGGTWLKRSDIRAEYRRRTCGRQPIQLRRTLAYRGMRFVYRSLRPRPVSYLASGIYPLRLPLPAGDTKDWKVHNLFRGRTRQMDMLSCHASSLKPGITPHPPHSHREEEILLLLAGEVELIVPGTPGSACPPALTLRPGQLVYYPAGHAHTLRAVAPEPANYLMFKWFAPADAAAPALTFARYDLSSSPGEEAPVRFTTTRLFQGPTHQLGKLHCHLSVLPAGHGYEPHVDGYDVAILVLEGRVETLGAGAEPLDVIFYATGEPHGMHNRGPDTARYVVFEFHGRRLGLAARLRARARR